MNLRMKLQSRRGFSLIEALIVVAIISIASAVAVALWGRPYIQNTNLSTAAQSLSGDIYNLKQQALQDRMQRITFDVGNNLYNVFTCVDQNSPCGDFGVGVPKSFNGFGSGARLLDSAYAGNVLDFQTRGTTTQGSVNLTNDRGSIIKVSTYLSGRVSVEWTAKK